MSKTAISVVICTRNRAGKLKNALTSLEDAAVPSGLSWEVVVVDNGSTDDTKAVVESVVRHGKLPLRYAVEMSRGASNARNTAIASSEGAIIASIDDDCVVERNWLMTIEREFREHTDIDVIGGRVELFDQADKAVTIRTESQRYDITGPSRIFASIPGCNIAYRREIAEKIGGFDPRFGPGAPIPAAEDPDFLYRALKAAARLTYVPEMVVFHDHGRRTEAEVAALADAYLIGRGGFYCKHLLKGDCSIARITYWELRHLVGGILKGIARGQPGKEAFKTLWALLRGAARYLSVRHRSQGPD